MKTKTTEEAMTPKPETPKVTQFVLKSGYCDTANVSFEQFNQNYIMKGVYEFDSNSWGTIMVDMNEVACFFPQTR